MGLTCKDGPIILQYLIEACEKAGIDVTELKKLEDTEEQHSEYDVEQQSRVITEIKEELQKSDVKDIVQADHLADTLLQNISLGKVINSAVEGNVLRDQLMAENAVDPFYGRAEGQFMYFYFRSQWTYRAVWKLWHG